jgi:hypothetical protein
LASKIGVISPPISYRCVFDPTFLGAVSLASMVAIPMKLLTTRTNAKYLLPFPALHIGASTANSRAVIATSTGKLHITTLALTLPGRMLLAIPPERLGHLVILKKPITFSTGSRFDLVVGGLALR